ncbi:MAG: hydroxymethylglutaryl-CoA lyase [Phycisphaerales bacterium]
MSERVRITDVAPRDGLQNEPGSIPTDEKAELVGRLAVVGVDEVEVSSFVSPRWVPQLGDASELFALVADAKPEEVVFSALVPNEKGMRAALHVNEHAGRRVIDKVSVFTAASETFSERNTNASIAESIERFRPVVASARGEGLAVRGYVSCAIACPFEGAIEASRVAEVCGRLLELGVDELDLGDTIGAGTPETVEALLMEVIDRLGGRATNDFGQPSLTLHLHDTFGRAAECVTRALEMGIRSFDGSVAGLGGCPYAATAGERAPGNIATSTLVSTIEASGYETGVDRSRLAAVAAYASRIVNAARLDRLDEVGDVEEEDL